MAIGLYIHVPFCLKKCRYCDFISYPYSRTAAKDYLAALIREIQLYGSFLDEVEKETASLFIGGGTPTCLPMGDLREILGCIRSIFRLTPDCEITVEANPGTIDAGGLYELRRTGVNRLSIGVQSLADGLLKTLGRVHNAAQAGAAVRLARQAGFDNINIDLIYGIPGQTLAVWQETLDRTVAFEPEHVAAYGLQLEEGTPLERSVAIGDMRACPEELELSMYHTAIISLKKSGYHHYEISNFARPGRECVHNLVYWLNLPFLGLGPAAHSCFRGERFANEREPEKYRSRLRRGELRVADRETLTVETEMSETMFLGLRLLQGVSLAAFRQRFGRRLEDVYRSEIKRLTKDGLTEIDGDYLRLTERGLPLANRVFLEFV
ncbi:Oxygen-independent coproporphyrinogen-III oxidase 1 [Pelotomaculum sp. FP]|uniref:radical SAM family heme chaperone HemW n=1 Tax=Pelotomaculum sp. FP TaxID=261474 RepID=UPI0010659BA4|nr:radical SAM family heme chaperone HemW [Pelotomaculum sp. FP]TEB14907.1 Oxygen-independent coproporphyrinogen-III oxidase 1 [Pelotomaculum sp. FP]